VALAISLCASAEAGAASYSLHVGSDGEVSAIGDFRIRQDPSLARAQQVFGTPDTRRNPSGAREACSVHWRYAGLKMTFSNFGLIPAGRTACDGEYGSAQVLAIAGDGGRRWRTWAGLRIGMRERAIWRRHPSATRHSNSYWLTTVSRPHGAGCPCPAPGIRAKVKDGRVVSFHSWLGTAGD
jgi:hypothetical protein